MTRRGTSLKETSQKSRAPSPTPGELKELVFVVDVTSFTKDGFIGSSKYEGRKVNLAFDEGEDGLFIDPEMAKKVGTRAGAPVSIVVEGETITIAQSCVAAVGKTLRVSDTKVYHALGKDGGGVLRVRSA